MERHAAMMRAILSKGLALALVACLAAIASAYPANKAALGAAVAVVGALVWWRPALWLLIVPALLPVLDLAPWTGWFFIDELDLLLLTCAAVGYWRVGAGHRQARLPKISLFLLVLVTLSFGASALVGLMPFEALSANTLSDYMSHYNSLRVFKGFAWALLLLPLLLRTCGEGQVNLRRYFVPGMLLGLAFACAAVLWERAAFPGLTNFSSDYRPTAPFSAMHTGGAALDAYLAISFPFIALWLVGAQSRRLLAVAVPLLLLGAFAGLTLFSRDIYLAFGSALVVLIALMLLRRRRTGTLDPRVLGAGALALAAGTYLLHAMFLTSGYRGLGAALGLLGATWLVGAARRRPLALPLSLAVALLLLLADAGLYVASAQGAYVAYALAAAVAGAGALLLLAGAPARQAQGLALVVAAVPALALATLLVALHWGGDRALGDAALAIGGALLLIAANRLPLRPLFELNRAALATGLFYLVAWATVIPIAGSYYAGARFATVGSDIDVRLRHWEEALAMMPPTPVTTVFGMGLGRYPSTYFWNNNHGELPGSYSFQTEANGNKLLRLGTPKYDIGYGEVLRMLQRVDMRPGRQYRLSLDLLRPANAIGVNVAICQRWLLYPQNCVGAPSQLHPVAGKWQHFQFDLASGQLGEGSLMRLPTQLELSAEGANATVEVDNVSLVDRADGSELVSNGSFSRDNDYWFFSSDRNHFPWHIKNFFVNTYFEMGMLGALSLGLLLATAAGQLARRSIGGDFGAGVALAAITSFIMIGLFDSLFDVPRLTLVFFLVLFTGLLVAPPLRIKRRRRSAVVREPIEDDILPV
jgi:hypothetical protein